MRTNAKYEMLDPHDDARHNGGINHAIYAYAEYLQTWYAHSDEPPDCPDSITVDVRRRSPSQRYVDGESYHRVTVPLTDAMRRDAERLWRTWWE